MRQARRGCIARLFAVTPDSPARLLHLLTELAAARAAGCAGATASLWELDEVAATAASHPELAAVVERQVMVGEGPIIAALRSGEPSVMADMLHEDRWPDRTPATLAAGVRSSATVTHEYEPLTQHIKLAEVAGKVMKTRADPVRLPAQASRVPNDSTAASVTTASDHSR